MQKMIISNKNDKIEMTKLAIGHRGLSDPSTHNFVKWTFDSYLDAGGNCIDTARLYEGGLGERAVGQYLKGRQRDKIVLISKCAHYDRSVPNAPHRLAPEDIRSDIDTSLSELDTDYIDIMFLHRDDIKRPIDEIMPVLHEYVKAGKMRQLGASNWTAGRIAAANKFAEENGLTPFSVSQLHYSLGLTTPGASNDNSHVIMDDIEYSWYKETKFPVMAWTAGAQGYFAKLAAGETPHPGTLARYDWVPENHQRLKKVIKLASELEKPVSAVVLAYIMCDYEVPSCAITAFSKEHQFHEAMAATEITLTRQQRRYLESGQ